MSMPISIQELRSLVSMNSQTGELQWKSRGVPAWDTKYAGTPALATKDSNGYLRGSIHNRGYYAHRVVFALREGRWPNGDVDHIDHDRANNDPCNLREATRAQNCQNASPRGGSSKFLGVSWDKSRGKWLAGIRIEGRRVVLGRFETEREAAEAYDVAAIASRKGFASPNLLKMEMNS